MGLNICPATEKEKHKIIIQRNGTLSKDLWGGTTQDFCEDLELQQLYPRLIEIDLKVRGREKQLQRLTALTPYNVTLP